MAQSWTNPYSRGCWRGPSGQPIGPIGEGCAGTIVAPIALKGFAKMKSICCSGVQHGKRLETPSYHASDLYAGSVLLEGTRKGPQYRVEEQRDDAAVHIPSGGAVPPQAAPASGSVW